MSDILEAARAFTKSHLRMPKQVRHDCWRLSAFLLRNAFYADNRLGIGGAAKPLRSNGGGRAPRNPGKPDLPNGREPPEGKE